MKPDPKEKSQKDNSESQRCNRDKEPNWKDKHKAPPDGAAVRKEPGVE
jgi:hypothetical protein